jgi:hypothetical protein
MKITGDEIDSIIFALSLLNILVTMAMSMFAIMLPFMIALA